MLKYNLSNVILSDKYKVKFTKNNLFQELFSLLSDQIKFSTKT